MDDGAIINLYWQRSEAAIGETQAKYGGYCRSVAMGVLRDKRDAEECLNDVYMCVWNSVPPQRPQNLRAYLGVLTRNVALDRCDYNRAAKRGGENGQILSEFAECMPDRTPPAEESIALKDAINGFLASLDSRTRIIFMRRYWFMCTLKEIADGLNMGLSAVKVTLHRTRNAFKEYLEKEGINL